MNKEHNIYTQNIVIFIIIYLEYPSEIFFDLNIQQTRKQQKYTIN
jgi:hypothetical protein